MSALLQFSDHLVAVPGPLAEEIEEDKAQRASLHPCVPAPSMSPVPAAVATPPPVMMGRLVALVVVVQPPVLACMAHLSFLPPRTAGIENRII